MALCLGPVFSEAYVSANDMDATSLSSSRTFDSITIVATGEKGVAIDRINPAKEAPDGEVFNLRIKLNGSGKRCTHHPMGPFWEMAAGKILWIQQQQSRSTASQCNQLRKQRPEFLPLRKRKRRTRFRYVTVSVDARNPSGQHQRTQKAGYLLVLFRWRPYIKRDGHT